MPPTRFEQAQNLKDPLGLKSTGMHGRLQLLQILHHAPWTRVGFDMGDSCVHFKSPCPAQLLGLEVGLLLP